MCIGYNRVIPKFYAIEIFGNSSSVVVDTLENCCQHLNILKTNVKNHACKHAGPDLSQGQLDPVSGLSRELQKVSSPANMYIISKV